MSKNTDIIVYGSLSLRKKDLRAMHVKKVTQLFGSCHYDIIIHRTNGKVFRIKGFKSHEKAIEWRDKIWRGVKENGDTFLKKSKNSMAYY